MYAIGTMTRNDNYWVLVSLLVFAVIGTVPAAILMLRVRGTRPALLAWAKENGLELLEAKYRWFLCGPFTFPRAGQSVYRIRVRRRQGPERSGFARVGNAWGLGSHVKVAWDRE